MENELYNKSDNNRNPCFFMLRQSNDECLKEAIHYIENIGVKSITAHSNCALFGYASDEQLETARSCGLFPAIFSKRINRETLEKLSPLQQNVADLWNHLHSPEYKKVVNDFSGAGKSWNAKDRNPPLPFSLYEPEDFKQILKENLGIDEDQLLKAAKKSGQKLAGLDKKAFQEYERRLEKKFKDPTIAYHLARIAYRLDPVFYPVIEALEFDFVALIFAELGCWKMENEISVGVVFVESSRSNGPKFSNSTRNTLQARVFDGLNWLSQKAPAAARLTWVIDWQYTHIDVANGTNSSNEAYWRDPAMGQISYNGSTYAAEWDSVARYREDMRIANISSHAIVIFLTPFANSWHGYAGSGRITLANRDNWGGWGINKVDEITSHEVCHLFGASDEYTGAGTPCSTCTSTHGCYHIPNGNCGSCAHPQQDCIMDGNQRRVCAYTQGQIGWADLFVELTTANQQWAGTDDDVWLDIGDRTFALDNPNHDDRERGNVEGYALKYTGINKNQIKRVGIRKSSDGYAGGWKLKRVRLWCRGELICDHNNINKWLEDNKRWWASSCGTVSSDIVNELMVKITTANVKWAGTDDDVRLYMGGRSWNLDNPSHDDFERGHTDTFHLDPGVGLYQSMLNTLRIHKSPDGIAGGWKLKGLQIYVNETRIYNNQSINKWIEDNDRDWFGNI
ncbi:MAG: PLAT/LH2 domain-containing protein [Pseudomonadota bacterium]